MKRIVMFVVMVAVGTGVVFGADLELEVVPPDGAVTLGKPLEMDLRFVNRGDGDLAVFQPDSIHKSWPCWALDAEVVRPDGSEFTLRPEVMYAMAPMPSPEHVVMLEPGDAWTVSLRLVPDEPLTTHPPSGWVAVIPISGFEVEHMPEEALKTAYGVDGEVYFISGARHWLALREVLADVFDQPGSYTVSFTMENRCVPLDAKGVPVPPEPWQGAVTGEAVIEVTQPE